MKRALISPEMPYDKRLQLENSMNDEDRPLTSWMRPSQFLYRYYQHILDKYNERQHFSYTSFVVFKSKNARMTISTRPRGVDQTNMFVFKITIEDMYDNLLQKWEHAYNWQGGWFITHLKLLCLLDQ